jgi:hypothetical protein
MKDIKIATFAFATDTLEDINFVNTILQWHYEACSVSSVSLLSRLYPDKGQWLCKAKIDVNENYEFISKQALSFSLI